jgi:hypothetical protein
VKRPPNKAMALTAGTLAAVVAAIAIPAWAASAGSNQGSNARGHSARPLPVAPPPGFEAAAPRTGKGGFPAPPPLNGKARKRLDETARCLRSHAADIPGVHASRHGFAVGPNVDRKELQKAAKACGAPPLPPRGATFQMRSGPPPKGRPKLPPRVARCLGAAAKRHGGTQG